MRIRLVLSLGLLAIALAGCDKFPNFLFGSGDDHVVLADKPMLLDTKPTHLAAAQAIVVRGVSSDLCLAISDDVGDMKRLDGRVINVRYRELMGGAHLHATLHARDGKDYEWKCDNGWALSENRSGASTMYSCMRWECNQNPPKGTEIASIDLSSDRPLRVLSAYWHSTAAFDHISQPPPDAIAVSSAEYKELEQAFGGKVAWRSPAKVAQQITLTSNHRQFSSSKFNSTLSLRMTESGIQLEPGPNAVGMSIVTIPTSAIDSCSMSCFGNLARETDLLLPETGIQLGVLNTPELIEWCWDRRLPMATSASRTAWLYKRTPLPAKDTYTSLLESRAAYGHQAHESCMGE